MQSKNELIQNFTQARAQLQSLLPQVDPHVEVYPGWTIKELLAHLAGWDDATIQSLKTFTTGQPPVVLVDRGADFYNAQVIDQRKELAFQQIVREWEWVGGQLSALLDQLPDENLTADIVSPWGQTFPVVQLLEIMIQHEEEHADAIRAAMNNSKPSEHKH